MNNYQWLLQMDGAERKAWFDAEHVENQEWALNDDADALNAKIAALEKKLRISWECECRLQAERELYRSKFGKCLDYADAIHALMDDEGMA